MGRISYSRSLGLRLLLIGCLIPAAFAAKLSDELRIGTFSAKKAGGSFSNWEPLAFHNIKNTTEYTLVEDEGTVVVKAVSNGGASGLIREVGIDPTEYHIIEWRWKVENVVEGSDWSRKSGDDYAARIYIMFDYDPAKFGLRDRLVYRGLRLFGYRDIPTRALNYIWATQGQKGAVVRNPYTQWVQMVIAQSGESNTGRWISERHNVLEDYRRAFGEDPPRIRGIAIMTDTDDTNSSATAYYGDISFRKR